MANISENEFDTSSLSSAQSDRTNKEIESMIEQLKEES